jgi:D-amino-acid oxidase
VNRRSFLKATSLSAGGLALTGCAPLFSRTPASVPASNTTPRRFVDLVPVNVSRDRIIRTTVGLRPHRPSGFVLRAERFDDKLLIHNYGHGGAGLSLAWGTGFLAAEHALTRPERKAAVIGAGAVGLCTARQLQRHGFDVTIYAASLPPETTSNMSWAAFTPVSGLYANDRRTPEWDEQFRRAVQIAYRELQLIAGLGRGVSWINEYSPAGSATGSGRGGGRGVLGGGEAGAEPLLPASMGIGRTVLGPGEHPFTTPYATVLPTMRFEPAQYLDQLLRDVVFFGGKIVIRKFETPRDLATLGEPIIVNCTGLGSATLFGDTELVPIKGQLVFLVPQPEVNYCAGGMMPRNDGIALGHVNQRGNASLEVDEGERERVIANAINFFGSMRKSVVG